MRLAGPDWPVPDCSMPCRRQKTPAGQIPYRRSDRPLNLLADGTGIRFPGRGEWQTRKHGLQRRRQWRKGHPAIDAARVDWRRRAGAGHHPIEAAWAQQAPDEHCRLPRRHAERQFHGTAGPDGGRPLPGLSHGRAGLRMKPC